MAVEYNKTTLDKACKFGEGEQKELGNTEKDFFFKTCFNALHDITIT